MDDVPQNSKDRNIMHSYAVLTNGNLHSPYSFRCGECGQPLFMAQDTNNNHRLWANHHHKSTVQIPQAYATGYHFKIMKGRSDNKNVARKYVRQGNGSSISQIFLKYFPKSTNQSSKESRVQKIPVKILCRYEFCSFAPSDFYTKI